MVIERPDPATSPAAASSSDHDRPGELARRARGRLLQIAVFGGALLGACLGMIAGTLSGTGTGSVVSLVGLISILSGYASGYALGWATMAVARRLEPGHSMPAPMPGTVAAMAANDPNTISTIPTYRPERSERWGGLIWLLLVTPSYLVAGMTAAAVAALDVLRGTTELGGVLSGFLFTLIVAWMALAPLTLAFAPSLSGRPKVLHRKIVGCSGTFWVGGFVVLWAVGSFMTVLLVLAALQSAFPTAYDRAADSSLLSVLMLVAWLALWAGGAAAIYRLVRRVLLTRG